MEIISLGSDCCITYQLQKHNFRTQAYPFDWLRCSLLDAIRLIGNKFDDMLDDLYFTRTSTNFKFTTQEGSSEINPVDLGYIYKSHRYPSLEFCHDFKDDHLGNLSEVSNKFSRRSNRFLDIFNNKSCSFIHYTTKPITDDVLQLWDFSISKPLYIIFSNSVISNTSNSNDVTATSGLEKGRGALNILRNEKYKNIYFIEDNSEYVSWHRDNFNWSKLFEIILGKSNE